MSSSGEMRDQVAERPARASAACSRATTYSDWSSSPPLGVKLEPEVRQPLAGGAGDAELFGAVSSAPGRVA